MSVAASAVSTPRRGGFWRRVGAMLVKEFLQLRRDRITFATMITLPLFQLMLFGYAINTVPRDMPMAVLVQENSDVGRSILAALRNTKYFRMVRELKDEADLDRALASGEVLFAVEIPDRPTEVFVLRLQAGSAFQQGARLAFPADTCVQ